MSEDPTKLFTKRSGPYPEPTEADLLQGSARAALAAIPVIGGTVTEVNGSRSGSLRSYAGFSWRQSPLTMIAQFPACDRGLSTASQGQVGPYGPPAAKPTQSRRSLRFASHSATPPLFECKQQQSPG